MASSTIATQQKDDKCLEELGQVNKLDENGRSALHSACQKGHTHCVKELFKAGAELDITDIEGNTALMYGGASVDVLTV